MNYVTSEFDRNQLSMAPMSFDELIDAENPVRVIDSFIDAADLSSCKHAKTKATGRPAYDPRDMMKLYIYGYFNGIRSSRKLERECKRNIELMWLINRLSPDDKTISAFRKDNKKAIVSIFKQFSMLCHEMNLIGKEIVAIDGSKFRANNSRKNNYTKNKVAKMLKHFEESAERYLALLETSEDSVEQELVQQKLDCLQEKIAEVTQLAQRIEKEGNISLIDPDSKQMSVSNQGTDVSHNMQTAVDSKAHLIVAVSVTSSPQDNGQLSVMAEQTKSELDVEELTVLADKGYYNARCLRHCQENKIKAIVSKSKTAGRTGNDAYLKDNFRYVEEENIFICPQGHKMHCVSAKSTKKQHYKTDMCKSCPQRELCTTNKRGKQIFKDENFEIYKKADALFSENKTLYKQRQMIVEHPFGTLKRSLGFTYLLTRGHENVENECYLHCLTYNFIRVIHSVGIAQILQRIQEKMPEIAAKACCFCCDIWLIFRNSLKREVTGCSCFGL